MSDTDAQLIDTLAWYVEMWRKPGFRRDAEEAVKTLTKDHPQAFGTLQRRFDEATLEIRNAHAAKQKP